VHLELDEQGAQFVRFSSDTKDEVKASVAKHRGTTTD